MADGEPAPTVVVVVHDGIELVSVELAQGRPDLALVDALARLQLLVSRFGGRIHLRDACPELCGLLDLVGLATVLPAGSEASASAVKLVGQAEDGEQRGVEEV